MNAKAQMPNDRKYDLEERTAVFGENIIDFVKTLPKNVINNELVKQIVRSGTSVGANYTCPVKFRRIAKRISLGTFEIVQGC